MAEQYLPNYANNILGAFQQGQDRGKQSKLAQLLGTAVNDPAQRQSAIGQAAMIDPGAAMSTRSKLNDESLADLSRDAGVFLSMPDDQKAAAYPQLAQKAQAVFGHPLPTQYDPKYAPMIEKIAQSGGGATGPGVQSTYIDGQGNRVAIMRDGRSQVIGQNAPNNQIIDTGNGFYGVNKGNLQAAPVNIDGQPQRAPSQAPPPQVTDGFDMQTLPGANVPQSDEVAMIAAGKNPGTQYVPQANGGAAPMAPPQQLRSAPKPQAPSALDERIATARQMGATPEQIKQMVVGSAGQASAPDVPGDTSKTGTDYLATLPQQTASQVRALADGRMQFPSGTALKSPYWQGMLSAVSQYDPNFDAVNYNARSNTRKAFTSGTVSQSINALNTVAEHIGLFSDNAQALHNTGFPLFNRLKNAYLSETGDPRIAAFNTNKKAVADEVAKVWRATGGSEADIQENLKNLDGAQSPEQLNAAIGTLTELIHGKINAFAKQYADGMGTTQTPRPLVSKGAQAAFDKTLRRMSGGGEPAKSAGPKVIRYDAQGNRIP